MADSEPNDYNVKIKPFVFERNPDNGYWIGPDGCEYDTKAEAMYHGMTVGCGCGCPNEVHQFLIDCLKQFDRSNKVGMGVQGIERIIEQSPGVAAEFIGHYLNEAFLAEHGGSVYGSWLTERGKQFIGIGPIDD